MFRFTALNSDLSNIGTIIYGAKYTFSIANNGNGGDIGYINLTKGTWLLFAGGWCPCSNGYVEITNYNIAQGWGDTTSFQFSVSGIVKLTANTTLKARLTNWGNATATTWTNGYLNAIRIA